MRNNIVTFSLFYFFSSLLLAGCYHYIAIPKDQYLNSKDHSDAKIILDNKEELIIDKEEDIVLSSGSDSIFVKNRVFSAHNIATIKQNNIDWVATSVFSSVSLWLLYSTILLVIYLFG